MGILEMSRWTVQGGMASSLPVVRVVAAGVPSVVGVYLARDARVKLPAGFAKVCEEMHWHTHSMWKQLADQEKPWFEADNGSYIYRNVQDGKGWIDEPSGGGVYIAASAEQLPPTHGWHALEGSGRAPLPQVEVTSATPN